MKIVSIKDEYINKLYKVFPHIMLNKNEGGRYGRKYIGVLFRINNINYYAPLSSPKSYDFNKNGLIKNNNLLSIKIIYKSKNQIRLLGNILLNAMIPVPNNFINNINIKSIKDIKYKKLLLNELKWISINQTYIKNAAISLYNIKKNQKLISNNNVNYHLILPYIEIENYIRKHFKKIIV